MQKLLRDAQQAAEAERKQEELKRAEEMKRNAEVAKQLAAGQAAMTAKKYAEAVQAYTAAAKLKPTDAAIQKALRDAHQALEASQKTPVKPPEKVNPLPPVKTPAALHDEQMKSGAALEKQGKWAEAAAAYQAALKVVPGEVKAAAALKNAQVQQHLSAARTLHTAKKFTEAVKEYEEALKLQPANAEAQNGLQRARMNKP